MSTSTPRVGITRANRPVDRYTPIANSFARSKLKPRAKVVALYLLSHSEGFVATQARIAREIGIGVSTVSDALEDLEAAGLLQRRTVHGEGGHIVGTEYVVSDTPLTVESNDGVDLIVKSLDRENLDRDFTEPKKITSTEKIIKDEKITAPQGGEAAPDGEPAAFSAKDVVAAYVDSFRITSKGKDPAGRYIAQVGREAKKLIEQGAESADLLKAASDLGRTPYASLEQQYMRLLSGQPVGGQAVRTGTSFVPSAQTLTERQAWFAEHASPPPTADLFDGPQF